MSNYEYYLNTEYTLREYIQDLTVNPKIDVFSLPTPLIVKLVEVFFLDEEIFKDECRVDYMSYSQESLFIKMAFGQLSSTQQYKLMLDLYTDNKEYIYSYIDDIYNDTMSEIDNEIRQYNPLYMTEHQKYVQGVIHDGK